MTIVSSRAYGNKSNLRSDTIYARRRSAGANEVNLNNVINALTQANRIINTYSHAGPFSTDWGVCQPHRDTTSWLPNVYNLAAGSRPGGVLGAQMTQTIKNDMYTIWLDLARCLDRRGLGLAGGGYGVGAEIVTAHAANGTALDIIVYKGRSTDPNQAVGSHFYHYQMTDP